MLLVRKTGYYISRIFINLLNLRQGLPQKIGKISKYGSEVRSQNQPNQPPINEMIPISNSKIITHLMMPKDARIIPRITPNPRTNAMMRNIIPIQINVDIFSPYEISILY